MVWKTWSGAGSYRETASIETLPKKRQEGNIIVNVGTKKELSVERIPKIDDNLLGYNLDGKKVLLKVDKNDRLFDYYISLPFTKGVTERETGRTLLIIGSNLHHIAAMQYQFNGVLWTKTDLREVKTPVFHRVYLTDGSNIDSRNTGGAQNTAPAVFDKYGDSIRWINVGDTKTGFIGLDYDMGAKHNDGVATNIADVKFLAQTLLDAGYDSKKKLYLLKPPYIEERVEGKKIRLSGIETLIDAATKNLFI